MVGRKDRRESVDPSEGGECFCPPRELFKLGRFYSWGNYEGAVLPTLTFELMVLVNRGLRHERFKSQKIGSTRSAIGRIVTAYQEVQTVRSALEDKAH